MPVNSFVRPQRRQSCFLEARTFGQAQSFHDPVDKEDAAKRLPRILDFGQVFAGIRRQCARRKNLLEILVVYHNDGAGTGTVSQIEGRIKISVSPNFAQSGKLEAIAKSFSGAWRCWSRYHVLSWGGLVSAPLAWGALFTPHRSGHFQTIGKPSGTDAGRPSQPPALLSPQILSCMINRVRY